MSRGINDIHFALSPTIAKNGERARRLEPSDKNARPKPEPCVESATSVLRFHLRSPGLGRERGHHGHWGGTNPECRTPNPESQVVAAGRGRNEPGMCPEINQIASSPPYQGSRADEIADRRFSIADYANVGIRLPCLAAHRPSRTGLEQGCSPMFSEAMPAGTRQCGQQTTAGTVQSVEQLLHSSEECA